MRSAKTSLLLLILLQVCDLSSQHYFEYSEKSQDIYQDIIDLKLVNARAGIIEMQESEPDNLAILHLENYLDFFQLFITEDYELFKELEKNKSKRLKLIDKHLEDNNPYKSFVKAEINLQWALSRSKFDQLFKASREVLTAYNLLKENTEAHPDFIYNRKSLSIIHSLIETITLPGLFKKIFGIDGSIEQGISEIQEVIKYSHENNFIFTSETDAIYTFILFFQKNEKTEAVDYILQSRLDPTTSLLSNFLVSKILQRSGHNDKALDMLQSRPMSDEYSKFYYLDYMEGLSLLYKLDTSSIERIKYYLDNFKGRHYIKEANQKLAWASLVFDDNVPMYKYYMSQVQKAGYKLIDDDKQAYIESQKRTIIDPLLLRARLLYDGGYYERAYTILTRNTYRYQGSGQYTLEYSYRLGRVCQALKNYPDAIKYLNNTINNGIEDSSYYACNSALQLGYIYEWLDDDKKALSYFNKCLKMKPKDYKTSLHQKAKTGKKRLEE